MNHPKEGIATSSGVRLTRGPCVPLLDSIGNCHIYKQHRLVNKYSENNRKTVPCTVENTHLPTNKSGIVWKLQHLLVNFLCKLLLMYGT